MRSVVLGAAHTSSLRAQAEIANADAALAALSKWEEQEKGKENPEKKTLILISSVMTWARTPPKSEGDGEDAERVAISDENFKDRRALPAYKANLSCERAVRTSGYRPRASRQLPCSHPACCKRRFRRFTKRTPRT